MKLSPAAVLSITGSTAVVGIVAATVSGGQMTAGGPRLDHGLGDAPCVQAGGDLGGIGIAEQSLFVVEGRQRDVASPDGFAEPAARLLGVRPARGPEIAVEGDLAAGPAHIVQDVEQGGALLAGPGSRA